MKTAKHTQRFVMVGTGNLATHLCHALCQAGLNLAQVLGRDEKKTKAFAKKFKASATTNFSQLQPNADFYFICVKDEAITSVAQQLHLKTGIVLHCSGSTHLSALKSSSPHTGVFYPLSTFSKKDTINFSEVPIFIEGSSAATEKKLKVLAKKLSKNVISLSSGNREKLHLAAVMSANFSNFLFTLSAEFLEKEKAGQFTYLLPLLKQTVSKLSAINSKEAQTGPARRKDQKTMQRHLQILKNYPEQRKLYKLLSSGIRSRY